MPMPKGYKSKYGYAIVTELDGGKDYRYIAQKMTSKGSKMNHSTARNIFMNTMSKFAKPVCNHYGIEASPKKIDNLIKDPRFQSVVADLLKEKP
jgi:hypothetical protein